MQQNFCSSMSLKKQKTKHKLQPPAPLCTFLKASDDTPEMPFAEVISLLLRRNKRVVTKHRDEMRARCLGITSWELCTAQPLLWTLQLDGLIGAISKYNVAVPTGAHYSGLTHLEPFHSHPSLSESNGSVRRQGGFLSPPSCWSLLGREENHDGSCACVCVSVFL